MGSSPRDDHAALLPRRAQPQPSHGNYDEGVRFQGNVGPSLKLFEVFADGQLVSRCTRLGSKHGDWRNITKAVKHHVDGVCPARPRASEQSYTLAGDESGVQSPPSWLRPLCSRRKMKRFLYCPCPRTTRSQCSASMCRPSTSFARQCCTFRPWPKQEPRVQLRGVTSSSAFEIALANQRGHGHSTLVIANVASRI